MSKPIARLVRRRSVDAFVDWLRFRMDAFPHLDYQPMPWLGLPTAKRMSGVASRWEAMRGVIESHAITSGLDIGCNVGFFTVQLAMLGIPVIGVESRPKYVRILTYSIQKLGLEKRVGLLHWTVGPDNIQLLPTADCVLFLAVWHHIVKAAGVAQATSMLKRIWSNSGKLLFFETGETEMPAEFGLPAMSPDPRTYLGEYLARTCVGGRVLHLGQHQACTSDDSSVLRNLFCVERR